MDYPDHAGASDTCFHAVATDRAQLLCHDAAGAMAVEQNFRMRVKIPSERGNLWQKRSNSVWNLHCFPIPIWTLHKNNRKLRLYYV